jgi:gamma-butyrobetaine dioxygenase
MKHCINSLARAALKPTVSSTLPIAEPTVEICNNAVRINAPEAGLHQAEFPFLWLRDACQTSVDASTRQKLFKTTDIPRSIKPVEASLVGGQLKVHWNQPLKPSKSFNTQTSVYPLEFLSRYASGAALNSFLRLDEPLVRWNGRRLAKENLTVPYDRLHLPQVKAAALRQTLRYGIVFFSGVPTEDKSDAGCELAKLSSQVGSIRRTWYGEHTWDVRSMKESKNIAYTNLDLGMSFPTSD